MNFFEHQERARRNTFLLIIYYIFAVLFIACAVYIVFALVFVGYDAPEGHVFTSQDLYKLWNTELFIYCFCGTLLVVAFGSIYKIMELASGGGEAVAIMLGGIKIKVSTNDPAEKKVLNIVEEMAIASGLPVPPVFILSNEMSINAFAAGYTRSDAVIGITRGAVQNLTRDELQGVIAHEFSHIVNGDMRINIRLIGILNGILIIALIGFWTFRMSFMAGSSSSSSSSKKKGVNVLPFIGIFLMIVGYIGVFFANIIKSAISRQREYLADASAVQFTRNPKGLGNALKKIRDAAFGSTISSHRSSEVSHMFFANGLNSFFSAFFATHPPIDKRIARISPDILSAPSNVASDESQTAKIPLKEKSYSQFMNQQRDLKLNPEDIVASIGAPDYRHVAYASKIISDIPSIIQGNIRTPESSTAVIYSLLIQNDEKIRKYQLDIVRTNCSDSVYNTVTLILKNIYSLWNGLRLPIIDLCIPALKEMDAKEYDIFIEVIDKLSRADNQLSIFEYTMGIVMHSKLDPFFGKVKLSSKQNRGLGSMRDACIELLSCLARVGSSDTHAAQEAFSKAAEKIYLDNAELIPANQISGSILDKALSRLTQASPSSRKAIVNACVACVISDSKITIEEAELLRAISEVLACPIPPFLPQNIN